MLEVSQYLELYLWKHYKPDSSSFSHLMSIIIMVNEKFRERVPAWEVSSAFCYGENLHNFFLIQYFI